MSRDTENPMVRDELWPRDANTYVPERVGKCETCWTTIYSQQTFYKGRKGGITCHPCKIHEMQTDARPKPDRCLSCAHSDAFKLDNPCGTCQTRTGEGEDAYREESHR
jgi:hypothetical protein